LPEREKRGELKREKSFLAENMTSKKNPLSEFKIKSKKAEQTGRKLETGGF